MFLGSCFRCRGSHDCDRIATQSRPCRCEERRASYSAFRWCLRAAFVGSTLDDLPLGSFDSQIAVRHKPSIPFFVRHCLCSLLPITM